MRKTIDDVLQQVTSERLPAAANRAKILSDTSETLLATCGVFWLGAALVTAAYDAGRQG